MATKDDRQREFDELRRELRSLAKQYREKAKEAQAGWEAALAAGEADIERMRAWISTIVLLRAKAAAIEEEAALIPRSSSRNLRNAPRFQFSPRVPKPIAAGIRRYFRDNGPID